MATTYDPRITALLCIDFYNDFFHPNGKLWPAAIFLATANTNADLLADKTVGIPFMDLCFYRSPGSHSGLYPPKVG